MAPLSYSRVEEIVAKNNRTRLGDPRGTEIHDRLFICLIWKESNFDPDLKSATSSATGLMQLTKGAVAEVNRVLKTSYEHANMTDPEKNVQVGTAYVDILMARNHDHLAHALDKFGTGSGYSKSIIECSQCLGHQPNDPNSCLFKIHT